MRLVGGTFAFALVALSCSPHAPASNVSLKPSRVVAAPCPSPAEVQGELAKGKLRSAAGLLDRSLPSCETNETRSLRAALLLDLARYEEAGTIIATLAANGAVDAPRLKADLQRRTTPASPANVARAAALYRQAIDGDAKLAPAFFLEAWNADPPNGLALIAAGRAILGRGHHAEDADQAAKARRLFEQGVAELERETGTHAHAGLRAPPICAGHFSNYLKVRWLRDSRHVVVECTDGSAVIDALSGERVANDDGAGVDEARLPRLRFGPKPPEKEPIDACGAAVTGRVHLDSAHGEVLVDSDHGAVRHALVLEFASLTKEDGARKEPGVEWSLTCASDHVLVHGTWENHLLQPSGGFGILDVGTGAWLGRTRGTSAHALDDGRFVIRGPASVHIFGPGPHASSEENGEGADLSFDGKRLIFVKEETVDEIYHPVWPYLKRTLRGASEEPIGDIHQRSSINPASFTWPRVGPLEPASCARLGTMPAAHDCAHPAISLDGIVYGTSDEVACSALERDRGDHDRARPVMCFDPRGPVTANDPWAYDLVCRIGPHVLPLAVCTQLLR